MLVISLIQSFAICYSYKFIDYQIREELLPVIEWKFGRNKLIIIIRLPLLLSDTEAEVLESLIKFIAYISMKVIILKWYICFGIIKNDSSYQDVKAIWWWHGFDLGIEVNTPNVLLDGRKKRKRNGDSAGYLYILWRKLRRLTQS